MIKVLKSGDYSLIETKGETKILRLDGKHIYAWVNVKDIGELLISSHDTHATDSILAMGKYRLYDVKDEPKITDLQHLELLVGQGKWQGYLLPTGLPTEEKKRKRIIPTKESISLSFVGVLAV